MGGQCKGEGWRGKGMRKVLLFVVASHSYVTSASSIGKDYLIHHLTIANGDIQTSIKFCVFWSNRRRLEITLPTPSSFHTTLVQGVH